MSNVKTDILEVIKIRPFLFLWLGQVTSQIAINMLTYVLALRVYQSTGSNAQVSILVLSIAIPALVFGMIAGVYVDRAENKIVLVFCSLLRAVGVLGFFLSSESLLWVVLFAIFMSTVTQFFVPAEAPTIPTIVPQRLLLTANSLFTFTFYGSMIIGFIFAGPALMFFGSRNVFLLLCFMFSLASIFVRFLPGPSARRALLGAIKKFPIKIDIQKLYRLKGELFEGYSFIKGNQKVLTAISLMVAAQASIAVLGALAPGFADSVLKINIEDSSMLLLAPAATGLIIGALLIGQFGKRWKKDSLINCGVLIGGLSLLMLSFTNRIRGGDSSLLTFAMVLMFFMGIANALIDVTCNTILQCETTDDYRGRVYGVLTAFVGGVSILPVILAGVLSDVAGVNRVMFVIGLFVLGIWFYRLRKLRYN